MSQLTSVDNLPCCSQVNKHIHIETYTYTWYVVTTGYIQGCGHHGYMGLWSSPGIQIIYRQLWVYSLAKGPHLILQTAMAVDVGAAESVALNMIESI